MHEGHFKSKLLAKAFFRARIGRAYLTYWRTRMQESREDDDKLMDTHRSLHGSKKRRIFKTWRT